jgi:hypothetical protein
MSSGELAGERGHPGQAAVNGGGGRAQADDGGGAAAVDELKNGNCSCRGICRTPCKIQKEILEWICIQHEVRV